ncbi:LOW QUALITY PROTEIN: olfactory receptor 10R2-like [Antechinus flavipes]|uniref:LOW QUALITY PROTEIN: olfactory receptor 10R2-like n=1 Tax=Antechinus flavipes TaxID=38775 RepID=UPI002235D2B7|nr:LOW QUALITY PROTEIN: olfactory receptor 10R2-like [Antechinus flavipes]
MKSQSSDEVIPWRQLPSENITMVTEFLLMGFSKLQEMQVLLFVTFLFLYLVILIGNITIVTVIILEHSLHTPMYFFLGALSVSETCYTFAILPKMLINLLSVLRTISFTSCAFQMFLFLSFAANNCLLLVVMGYDRYAAICHPLRYPIIMNWRTCRVLVVICGVTGFLISTAITTLVFSLPFCNSNKINHYFCDISPVIHLACGITYVNELFIFICSVFVLVVPFIFICVSYGFIVSTILKIPSTEGKKKAFSTCVSHLTVVVVHYGCASFVYLRPSSRVTSIKDQLITVTYTIITPLLNPMVYSLRNRAVQVAIQKVINGESFPIKLYNFNISQIRINKSLTDVAICLG